METIFSVIITTYKRNEFLKRAINQTILQKKPPLEIIIVDDYGSVETKNIVRKFNDEVLDITIKYIYPKILRGQINARNIGAKVAKGNYLAFLDDDDFWNENYLANISNKIDRTEIDLCISDFYKFESKDKFYPNEPIPKKFKIENYLFSNPGAICSNLVIKKVIFDKLKGFDVSTTGSSDKDLYIRANLNNYKCLVLQDKNMFYQIHDNQLSLDKEKILKQRYIFFKKYFKFYLRFDRLYKILNIFKSLLFRILKKKFLKNE